MLQEAFLIAMPRSNEKELFEFESNDVRVPLANGQAELISRDGMAFVFNTSVTFGAGRGSFWP
jgi:hypothetical protein